MRLTNEQKIKILHDSARKCNLDSHVTIREKKIDLQTHAEKMMGNMSHVKNPHKNSYLYFDSVDACFYIERETACVTFTARWGVGSKDLSISKIEKALISINKMLETIVVATKQIENGTKTKRWRRCTKCNKGFTTTEEFERETARRGD